MELKELKAEVRKHGYKIVKALTCENCAYNDESCKKKMIDGKYWCVCSNCERKTQRGYNFCPWCGQQKSTDEDIKSFLGKLRSK